METLNLNRRKFIQGVSATIALSTLGTQAKPVFTPAKTYKVALIGTGWYGKSDLFRLIQVASVDVVALCDPDQNILKAAGDLVAKRQESKQIPKLYGDYRKLLAENKLDTGVMASAAVAGKALFVRTKTHLYRLEK